jgi:hypothetical protein
MQVTSILNVTLVLAMHGHVMGVVGLISDGHCTWAWAGAGVEQMNIATPSVASAAQLKRFLAIVLVRTVISSMVLLRRKKLICAHIAVVRLSVLVLTAAAP